MKLRHSRQIAAHYSSLLDCRPVEVRAEDFGGECLRRLLSVECRCVPRCKTFRQTFPQGPVLVKQPDRDRVLWTGAPMSAQVRSLVGYVFLVDPSKVQCGEEDATHALARPSRSRCNRCTEADRRVLHRFNHEGQQRPIMTYTEHSLAWVADKWRNPTAREKALIMGYSPSAVGLSLAPNPARFSDDKHSSTAAAALGRGCHVPSEALAMALIL